MIVDLHHHLDTLNFALKIRGMLQGHCHSIKDHLAKKEKVILNVALYPNFYRSYSFLISLIKNVKSDIKRFGPQVKLITTNSDFEGDFDLGIILHVESARLIKKPEHQLAELYDLGIRGVIPLHFIDNQFGNSCDDPLRRFALKKEDLGLTERGERFVETCNQLGLWLDLTHTSEQTGLDIIERANEVMVSHVGIRQLRPIQRNKPLSLLKKVAAKNGVIGLSPWKHLCGPNSDSYQRLVTFARENQLENSICIGSDFGAPIATTKQTKDIFSIAQIIKQENFLSSNAVNFFRRVLPN